MPVLHKSAAIPAWNKKRQHLTWFLTYDTAEVQVMGGWK